MSDEPAVRVPKPRRGRALVALVVLAGVLVVGGVAVAGLWQVTATPQFCNSCHIMRPYVDAWKVSRHRDVECVQCHYPPDLKQKLWVKFQAASQLVKWATQTYSSKPFADVQDASCLRSGCHARAELERKGTLTFKPGIRFDHRPHLQAATMGRQLRCTSCHNQTVVEKHLEVNETACFTCHFKGMKGDRELTPIAGCTSCHTAPAGQIQVGATRFDHAGIVQRGVACQSCHINVVEGQGEAPRERCLGCHNQPEKFERYQDVRLVHAAHVTEHSIPCTRCHSEIKHQLPPPVGATSPVAASGGSGRPGSLRQ